MRKDPFSQSILSREQLPAAAAIEIGKFVALAAIVFSLHSVLFRDYSYWKAFVAMALSVEAGELTYVFLLRPLRGQPPILRRRPTDNFETWPLGNGVKWSRLGERYSSDELILVFGVIAVMLLATMLWTARM